MSFDCDETVSCKKLDPTPSCLRDAVRRNAQMKRQLSKIRKSLTVEEKVAEQVINKGEFKLVARLKQLQIRAEKAAQEENANKSDTDPGGSATDLLDLRSKIQRKKFYKRDSRESKLVALTLPDKDTNDEEEKEIPEIAPHLQVPSPTDGSKYHLPSWQRAELINRKQKEEEKNNNKIYGKKR